MKNLDEIIQASDAIMIGRGFLALAFNYGDVVFLQKLITQRCSYFGKPCILSTNILDSMVTKLNPSRAEITDIS